MFQYILILLHMVSGTLIIPDISLYKPIEFTPLVDGAYNISELGYGVTYLEDTSWNDPIWGRTVLAGHTPGGFENLVDIKIGSEIILMSEDYIFIYEVVSTQIIDKNTNPDLWYFPTEQPSLLL